ncbi:primase-helicase family protein [Arcobacter sp. YIC-310]|uniref:primase-helicase family protein n=1 Tax=Arcobacter sp. YIC-310 TaxID=3376632 RepID=UPI003C1A76CE
MSISILQLLNKTNQNIYIRDVIEQDKGPSRAILNTKYLFNAYIYSHLRGGKKYKLDFDELDIESILKFHKYTNEIEKIIEELAGYLVSSEKHNKFVKNISKLVLKATEDEDLQIHFEYCYDIKYLENKAFKYMNSYALIQSGGKVGFIAKDKDVLEIYSKHDLKIKFENKKLKALFSKKINNPVDIFTSSKNREDYTSIVFKDPSKVKPYEYNLFKGWPYKPIKSVDTSFYWDFVRKVIANNDTLIFNVICSWMAKTIQNPFWKGTALVIIGEKGCGKGTFVKVFASLFGHYFMESADPKRIFGSFNSHLQNCLLLYGNEAFWSGQKADESKLKSLITDIDFVYEIKGSMTYKGENYTHLILDSNSDHVVLVTADERRYTISHAASTYRGNFEFFEQFNKLVSTKEFKESLMYDLMNFNYKPWEKYLYKAPMSEAVMDQLLHSLDLYEQWWFDVLENGSFGEQLCNFDSDLSVRVSNEALHESFKSFLKANGKKNYDSTATFIKSIKKRFLPNDLIIKETIKSQDGKNAKIISSLDRCRAIFTKKYGVEINSAINEWQVKTMPNYISKGY